MSNAFSRSWEITKLSFDVISKDKEMLLFPVLAGIFSLLFIIAMILPSILAFFIEGMYPTVGIFEYIIIFLIYLGLAYIATFFNVCVVYTAKSRFEGGNAKLGDSIRFAFSRIHLIFAWALVAATVGLLLRLIDNIAEKLGPAGKVMLLILNSILGMLWSIITIFVVPAMVYHNLGPFASIKKSVEVLKKTWGESLIRHFGLGLVQLLFLFAGIILAAVLFFAGIALGPVGILLAVLISFIYFLGVILVFSVANSVFNTALYVYADTGRVPEGYSHEIMANAFQSKPKKPSVFGGSSHPLQNQGKGHI